MGRKRWRRGGLELLVLLCVFHRTIQGDGEVGCLFTKNLCDPELETCYNDLAFGRCIPNSEDELTEDDLYQYDLIPDELELLKLELERLEANGYTWSHIYTQCVLEMLLNNLRYRLNSDVETLCQQAVLDNNHRLQENELVPEHVAIVKFTPSQLGRHGEFADEFYYPPDIRQRIEEQKNQNRDNVLDEDFYDKLDSIAKYDDEQLRNKVIRKKSVSPSQQRSYLRETYELPREYAEAVQEILESNPDSIEESLVNDELEFLANDNAHPKNPKQFKVDFLDQDDQDGIDDDYSEDYKSFDVKSEMGKPLVGTLSRNGEMYADGGRVVPVRHALPSENDEDDTLQDDLDRIFWREMAGFKRRERLDVKKPGPPFATNDFAFRKQSTVLPEENSDENDVFSPQEKKEGKATHQNVDMDHVYVVVNEAFQSWPDGETLVRMIENLTGMEYGVLKDIRVGDFEVTFKVDENTQNLNSTDVIYRIVNVRHVIRDRLKLEVLKAGIGDKIKLPPIFEAISDTTMSSSMFGAVVAAGVAAATGAAAVVLVVARRHAKSRAKLANLEAPDPEASKDYQDLCRARMQAKQTSEKTANRQTNHFNMIKGVSESNNSPSNRSSTSSWSDEPTLTNMDISTGHMVLSYMEDHLKNQERLDEEWAALSAYEPDPSSTAIAESESNAKNNRYGAALPYSHSRVVLNDLANINNSDYINASTIKSTDHDPRNPAYIATQGPMPQTSADFWQLVWEQGSVVIVMLTRLTEEGQAQCHRYWPEEGSELYHIYEVHLVSEHIWCDDYLVRSFYLKNLRTGETRTVTQFHYLSWPQNGVPHSIKALLEFRRKVNKSYRGRSCPIVVHCSDGGGRTGTYCLIDMVLNRMAKGAKEIDIAATLEHIRDQRPDMVANKKQFEFVLMAVAEEVHAILKALPAVQVDKPVEDGTSSVPQQTTKSDQ